MPETDIGRMLGRYRVTRRIGAGSMGEVFEGLDTVTGERVAIKILHAHLLSDPTFRERFEQEAHVTSLLQSPFTVRLHGYGVAGANAFLAMDFIDGPSVADVLEREARIDARRALGIALDVSRALEEAAIRGIVHRDIKPSNILLTADGHARLADFGIARRSQSAGMTLTGAYVGTVAYGAPEQQDGQVDHRSDIYALGATLYHMLAGRPPYSGGVGEVLRQHREAHFPASGLADQPDEVVFLVRRCMPKDPADRIQTASELAAAIERALTLLSRGAHAGTVAPPAPPAVAETRISQIPRQTTPGDETALLASAATRATPHEPTAPIPTPGGAATAMARICPFCGARNYLPDRYCRACGTALSAPGTGTAAPTVPAPLPRPGTSMPTAIPVWEPVGAVPAGSTAVPGGSSPGAPPHDPWRVALVVVSMITAVAFVVIVAAIIALRDDGNVPSEDGTTPEPTYTATATAPTPSRTPAPTATPKPGEAAYINHFDAGAQVPTVNNGTARIEGGQLILEHAAGGSSVAKLDVDQPYADVTIAVRAFSPDDIMIIACRHKASNNQYRATIEQSSQMFKIARWNVDSTDLVPWKVAGAIPKDSFMNVAFTCKGSTLTLTVNGTTLAQVTDSLLADGQVWLGLNGLKDKASTVRFDDLVVSRQ